MKDQPLELGGASPFSAYRLLSAAFGTGMLSVAFSGAAARTLTRTLGLTDFTLAAVATHKIAQVIASERVTMALRAPFTRQRDEGRGGERKEVPKEHGLHRAIGELLTCPYCLSPWVAAGLMTGYVFAPIPTRVVTTVFALSAASDWLSQRKSRGEKVTEAKAEAARKSEPFIHVAVS
ncbi:MAG: DUF1360 domain-containing protein [Polyangiales bacterium]